MYISMTEIGRLFGVSRVQIGKWLVEIGLRTAAKVPSPAAFDGGYVAQEGLQNGGYYYQWHLAKTVDALEEAGHKRVPQKSAAKITGPFTARQSGVNGYEIISGDGTVSIWVMGRENADFVTRLLNLAYKHGRLGGGQ